MLLMVRGVNIKTEQTKIKRSCLEHASNIISTTANALSMRPFKLVVTASWFTFDFINYRRYCARVTFSS